MCVCVCVRVCVCVCVYVCVTYYCFYCTLYNRPVRTNFFFAILKTFTSVTIMYAMMNKCLKFYTYILNIVMSRDLFILTLNTYKS